MKPIVVPGTVRNVTDGDTVHVLLDLSQAGIPDRADRRVRWRDFDAAEVGTPEGDAAKAYLETVLSPGEPVTVEAWEADQFGRVVGDVRIAGTGRSVSKRMARKGHVTPRPAPLGVADLPRP